MIYEKNISAANNPATTYAKLKLQVMQREIDGITVISKQAKHYFQYLRGQKNTQIDTHTNVKQYSLITDNVICPTKRRKLAKS